MKTEVYINNEQNDVILTEELENLINNVINSA